MNQDKENDTEEERNRRAPTAFFARRQERTRDDIDSASKPAQPREASYDNDRTDSFRTGPLTINIPAHCPDKAVFESVVREELDEHFGNDPYRAAFCKGEYDRCRKVPAAFRENLEAQRYYQKAQMALSPGAQQWDRFDDVVFGRFLDTTEDGDEQTLAIPGWYMEESLSVTVRDRSRHEGTDQSEDRGRDR